MGRRLLVNDQLTCIPGTRTLWNDLQEWFGCEFVGAAYENIIETVTPAAEEATLIIRNATWFPPLPASERVPTISLLQDIFEGGPQREMQFAVIASSAATMFNSAYTLSFYEPKLQAEADAALKLYPRAPIIPLPVDFDLFTPGNTLGLQQAHSLPDGCVCWVGAQSEIKGYDIFLSVVRQNPDIPFVAVFKDTPPEYGPPNMRIYSRLTQDKLAEVIGACRVGLCTSRMESQHLAGIEMGACGLPLVVPPVGTYWKRTDLPGILVSATDVGVLTSALRSMLANPGDPQKIRDYWKREFDKPVIRKAWEELVDAMEHSNRSDS